MKQEATLLGYKVLYNRAGKLITERTSTDIKELKPYFTTKSKGTGLGLSIVNKIISDHDGDIKFEKIKTGAKIIINFQKNVD